MPVIDGKLYVSWRCRYCGKGPYWALADTPILCTCMHVTASDPL